MGLAVDPSLHHRIAERHEGVRLLGLEVRPIQIEPRLVAIRLARGRAGRHAVSALVAEVRQHRDLEILSRHEGRHISGNDGAVGDGECRQFGVHRLHLVRHQRHVGANPDTQAADLVAVETPSRLLHGLFGRVRKHRFVEAVALVERAELDRHPVLAPCPADHHFVQVNRPFGFDRHHPISAVLGGNGRGYEFAVGGRLDDRRRSVGGDVAAGVHAGDRRLERLGVDFYVAPLGQLRDVVAEEAEHRMLADGQDQRVERDLELRVGHIEWDLAPRIVAIAAVLGLGADQPGEFAVFDMERGRVRQFDDVDALFLDGVDFLGIGRHLVDGAAIDQVHVLGSDSQRRTHGIHRRVARADDAHFGADWDGVLLAHAAQEADAVHHPVGVLTRKVQLLGELGSYGNEDGDIAVAAELLDGEVHTGLLAVPNLDPEFIQDRQVLIDLRLGEPVGRNRPADHSAGIGVRLEDGDRKPVVAEFLGGGEAGRAGADDGDLGGSCRSAGEQHRLLLLLHDEALHVADRQWLIQVGADACVLTQVIAHPAENRRQRVVLASHLHRTKEVAIAYRVHVLRHLLVDRALVDTRCLDAVEVVQLARSLRAIHPERVLLIPPLVARLHGILTEVDAREHLHGQRDDTVGSTLVEPGLQGPRPDDVDHGGGAVGGHQGSLEPDTLLQRQVQPGIGQGGELHHRGKLDDAGLLQRRLTDVVGGVNGFKLVESGVDVLHVLEHPQIATGLEQVGAHRDGPHPGTQQILHVEAVGPAGKRQHEIAAELLRDPRCQIGRDGVQGSTRQVHHLVLVEHGAPVVDLERVRQLEPERQAFGGGDPAQVVEHRNRVDVLQIVPERLVGNRDVVEFERVVEDAAHPIGAEQGRVAFDRGMEAAFFEQVERDLLDFVGRATVHGRQRDGVG